MAPHEREHGAMTTTFTAGEVTIHRIVEAERPFAPARTFFPDLDERMLEENRAWLQPRALEPGTDTVILCFQSHVVRTPHHTVLVDTCVGNDKDIPRYDFFHRKADRRYMDGLAAVGLTVADIDVVVCTHMHMDHVGWNTRLEDGRWVPTFPNACYLFGREELAFWTARMEAAPNPVITQSVLPVVEAGRATLVSDDHVVDDHLRLLPTPGHTPHHCSVMLGRDDAVITGDAIHSPLQARYPELSMFSDVDPAQAAVTRRALLERLCDTRTQCCASHFPVPAAGRITRWGDGFRCDPA
jgi:glyoxylase-like metal-dependent hydrolase (beta-lactamase superfamily II)